MTQLPHPFYRPKPKVTLADNIFTDRKALRAYAETSVISDFSVEELTDNGVYRKGDGIRFG